MIEYNIGVTTTRTIFLKRQPSSNALHQSPPARSSNALHQSPQPGGL
jgi:hypothetical protein